MARRRLEVQLGADVRNFQSGMSRANRTVQNFQSKLRRAGKIGAAALAAIGAASVKMSSDFEKEMTRVNTLVGLSQERVEGMRGEILQMARDTGQAPKELAQGLFRLTSGGIRGSDALEQLRTAAQASAVGMGNLADLTRTATTAANAFPGSDLTDVLNTMLLTVREGQIRVSRFQRALAQLQSPAAEVGLSFKQTAAFLATASRVMGGTQKAARGLRSMLARLQDPTDDMKAAFSEAGMSVEEFRQRIEEGDFQAAMSDLARNAKRADVSVVRLAGSTRAWAAITSVVGNQIDTFNTIMGRMQDNAGAVQEAFETTEQTTSLTFSKMVAAIKAAAVEIGENLAPAAKDISDAFKDFSGIVAGLANAFGSLPGPVRDLALALGLLGTVATPAVIALNQLVGLLTALQAATGASSMIGGVAMAVQGMGASLAGLVPLIAAGGTLLVGFKALQSVLQDVKRETNAARAAMRDYKSEVQGASRDQLVEFRRQALNAQFAAEQMQEKLGGIIQKADRANQRFEIEFGTIQEATAATQRFEDAVHQGGTTVELSLSSIQTLFNDAVVTAQAMERAVSAANTQLDEMGESGGQAAAGVKQAQGNIDDFIAATEGQEVVVPLEVKTLAEGGPGRKVEVPIVVPTIEGKGPEEITQLEQRVASLRSSLMTEKERIEQSMEMIKEAVDAGILEGAEAQKLKSRLRERLSEVGNEVSRFEKVIKRGAMRVGESLIEGIIMGADNMGDMLKRFLARLASTFIMSQLTGFLGIGSPSKLTMAAGEDLVRGLVVGMDAMEGRVRDAADRVARAATPQLAPVTVPGPRIAATGAVQAPRVAAASRVRPPAALTRGGPATRPPAQSGGGDGGSGEAAAAAVARAIEETDFNWPSAEAQAAAEYTQRVTRRALEIAYKQGFRPDGQQNPAPR